MKNTVWRWDGCIYWKDNPIATSLKFALHSPQGISCDGAVIDVTVKHLTLIELVFVGQFTESVVELELKYVSHEIPGERRRSGS